MKREGFTLIEVILSLAIVGIIAVSTLTIFNTSLINIKRAGNRTATVEEVESVIINRMDSNLVSFNVRLINPDDFSVLITTNQVEVNKIEANATMNYGLSDIIEMEIFEKSK